jgi:hypothetical protein
MSINYSRVIPSSSKLHHTSYTPTNMINPISKWSDYFANIHSSSLKTNFKISNFISASDPGITDDKVKENLTKDKGNSIMMTFDISGSMKFIHSITNLGGKQSYPCVIVYQVGLT